MKKILTLLLAGAMTVSMLTACGGTGGTAPESGAAAPEGGTAAPSATDAPKAGTTAISMWGSWSGDQVGQLDAQLKSFNESQDAISVKYSVQNGMEEKLLTAIAGGQVPDVVLWDRFATTVYAPKGALMPLDDLIARDSVDITQFYAPAADELTAKGVTYGLPLTVDCRILFYNKAMLAEANVDPASIITWDDLRDAAVKLTKRENGKLVQSGFSLKDVGLFSMWMKQAGGSIIDDAAEPAVSSFNNDIGREVLTYWDKMLNEEKVYDLGFEDGFGGDGFKAGKVAITYNGPWTITGYKDAGIDFGVIPPVKSPSDKGQIYTGMGGFGLVIPNKAKNVDQAWEFIKWWTTNPENGVEFAKISANLPANKLAAADSYFADDEILSVFSTSLEHAGIRSKAPGYSDFEGLATIPQLQKFMGGEAGIDQVLADAEKQGNQVLADAYAESNK